MGFEGLPAANTNFVVRGLGFGPLGEVNPQYAHATVGAHLLRIHGAMKRIRAGKLPHCHSTLRKFYSFSSVFELALAMNGEGYPECGCRLAVRG
jgi:hypothetical protein